MDIMEAIAHELGFWKGFVKHPRFLEGWVPKDVKTPDLHDWLYDYFMKMPDRSNKTVLDVGSGAVSILNGTFPAENITCIDPLGALYSIVFDYKLHDLRQPLSCGGEEIEYENEFDIVHISNALDHSQNPLEVFNRMLRAAKPGGLVIVEGFENEGTHQNWEGFHQFNFKLLDDGHVFYDTRAGERVMLPSRPEFHHYEENRFQNKDYFIAGWRKAEV